MSEREQFEAWWNEHWGSYPGANKENGWKAWQELAARCAAPAPFSNEFPLKMAAETYNERYGDGSGPEHVICPVCGFCQHCRDCEGEGMTQPENCPNKVRAAAPANPAPGYCPHCKQYTIAEPLPAEPQQPVAWLVLDEQGYPEFAAGWREAAHEHINDAINEHDIEGAKKWTVRPVFASPIRDSAWVAGAMRLADIYAGWLPGDLTTARSALEAWLK
jgi:hypothetical protein